MNNINKESLKQLVSIAKKYNEEYIKNPDLDLGREAAERVVLIFESILDIFYDLEEEILTSAEKLIINDIIKSLVLIRYDNNIFPSCLVDE